MDRLIPFLAAFVGLVALGGAVLVQLNADQRDRRAAEEIATLRGEIERLTDRAEALAATDQALAAADDDGTVDGLLALQDRMDSLEEAWAAVPETAVAATAPAGAFAANVGESPAEIDPDWPTEDCIPLGTRFMATTGDDIAICQTPVVVSVSAITGDNVMVDGTGVITETAFRPIAGSNCTLMVFSADAEGFAEMRVSCN